MCFPNLSGFLQLRLLWPSCSHHLLSREFALYTRSLECLSGADEEQGVSWCGQWVDLWSLSWRSSDHHDHCHHHEWDDIDQVLTVQVLLLCYRVHVPYRSLWGSKWHNDDRPSQTEEFADNPYSSSSSWWWSGEDDRHNCAVGLTPGANTDASIPLNSCVAHGYAKMTN